MRKIWLLGGGAVGVTVLAVLFGIAVAYQTSGKPEAGRVAPHTKVAGMEVGNLTQAELDQRLIVLESQYESASIAFGNKSETAKVYASEIDLSLDRDKTSAETMKVGRSGNVFSRIKTWLATLSNSTNSDVTVSWDQNRLVSAIAAADSGPRTEPTEPALGIDKDGQVTFNDGKDGKGLSAKTAGDGLDDAANKGLPLAVEFSAGKIDPHFDKADLETAFNTYKTAYQPIQMLSGTKTVPLEFATVQPWLRSYVSNDTLLFTADLESITKSVPGLMPDSGLPVVQAGWTVLNDVPSFQLGTPGSSCCDNLFELKIRDALFPANGVPVASVDLGLTPVQPKAIDFDPNSLGIKEKVATFTTRYPAGQPRVTNIHRISDLVRGDVISANTTWSLNNAVGPRTAEKGFVVDHVIVDGKFAESIGGGISQFSTTLFNASFFAGLEWQEYMSHSIYIDRYPYGREATISFPAPDQKIKNITPYSILIWPTYTPTSVTVDLYSTHYVDSEQTGQRTAMVNACTKVFTERTRRFVDGRTTVDNVTALYQPKEGVLCN